MITPCDGFQIVAYILSVTSRIHAYIDFRHFAFRVDEEGIAFRELEHAEIAQ